MIRDSDSSSHRRRKLTNFGGAVLKPNVVAAWVVRSKAATVRYFG